MKVELCKNFIASGCCPYGAKCRFAHGLKELLQNSELNSNFRTKNCKAFFLTGECKYGDRCNFKHDDRKLGEIRKEQPARGLYNFLEWYPELITCFNNRPLFSFSVLLSEAKADI